MYPLVFQSDFGLVDGAVSAMYGVAYSVCPDLKIHDLTHDITPYNIWEASYRLIQTIRYWPENTVFVSVVDPGVGTDRRSIVVRTRSGQYIVTPDNGTLTHVLRLEGVEAAREIDETVNRPCPAPGRATPSTAGMCTPSPAPGWRQVLSILRASARRSRWILWCGCPLWSPDWKTAPSAEPLMCWMCASQPVDQHSPGAVPANRCPLW